MRRISILYVLPLALAACNQQPSAPDASTETPIPVEPDQGIGDGATPPSAGSIPTPSPSASDGPDNPGQGIPMALQGRWGMVPADCTSTRGDAKGLLAIGPETLRFYESIGTLARETARSDTMIRGQFAFTGEGMNWTRDVTLSASGNTLTRIERGGEEPGGPFTYTKCPA